MFASTFQSRRGLCAQDNAMASNSPDLMLGSRATHEDLLLSANHEGGKHRRRRRARETPFNCNPCSDGPNMKRRRHILVTRKRAVQSFICLVWLVSGRALLLCLFVCLHVCMPNEMALACATARLRRCSPMCTCAVACAPLLASTHLRAPKPLCVTGAVNCICSFPAS